MLRSVLAKMKAMTPGAIRDRAELRARELRQTALEYAELVKQPGWQRLMAHIEAEVAAGLEAYVVAPLQPSKLNPMGSLSIHERQRSDYLAEARGMRRVFELPATIVEEARSRGLLEQTD